MKSVGFKPGSIVKSTHKLIIHGIVVRISEYNNQFFALVKMITNHKNEEIPEKLTVSFPVNQLEMYSPPPAENKYFQEEKTSYYKATKLKNNSSKKVNTKLKKKK